MNIFTSFVNEYARSNYSAEKLLQDEVTRFVNKVNKKIPTIVKDTIHLTMKYNLMDAQSIDEIRRSNKTSLKNMASKYNIPEDRIEDLWKMLKDLKQNIYLLPQFMSDQEREEFEAGKLAMNDLTIDLETPSGRNSAVKMYMPTVYKVVNQFVGKSRLSRPELISAGTLALANAINDWDRSKGVPFKTYVGTRVRQQILNDINKFGHDLSGYNDHALKKGYNADAVSLDKGIGSDGDTIGDLIPDNSGSYVEPDWAEFYKIIDDNFNTRKATMFYKVTGLKGYKKEKGSDVAKEYGVSNAYINNTVLNPIKKFISGNRRMLDMLRALNESYNISMMLSMYGMSRDEMLETMINDDIYILLEEINRWSNADLFNDMLMNALSALNDIDAKYIKQVLEDDFEFLDGSFKKHKKIIILFLNEMYPTESMNKKTDVSLLEYMMEIQDAYKKHNV